MKIVKFFQLAVLGLGFVLGGAAAAPAMAQDMNATVIVPDAPKGARFTGCYDVTQRLYGPYRMDFCLDQRGTYTVRGGGVTCDGRLDWSVSGRNIYVDLRKTSCGKGVAWSADSMTCQGTNIFGGRGGILGDIAARIIVPDGPTISQLRCTYTPAVRSEDPVTITARRTS